eukprot:scaffold15442_cov95-Amphora_coffeaeformis.AAC.1
MDAFECKMAGGADEDPKTCLKGWLTTEGKVDEDEELWGYGDEPDGLMDGLQDLAYITNIGGGKLYDNSPLFEYEWVS